MNIASNQQAAQRLKLATLHLYEEFKAPPPTIIEGCPCCIETRGVDVLLKTQLAELTSGDLWRYTTGAFLTIGGLSDFRYLLPRIFEVAAFEYGGSPGAEIVLGKLKRAEWHSWSCTNQLVVIEFVDAWIEHALITDVQDAQDGWVGNQAESVLCGASIAGIPLSRWSELLHSSGALPVLNELRRLHLDGISGFWEETPGGFSELGEILR